MNKLVLALAAVGTLGISTFATSSDADARGRHGFSGGGGGFRMHHGGGFRHGGHFGVRHFGVRHGGYRHWGHRPYRWGGYGVAVVGYGGGSCWKYRMTYSGYRLVNVCRPAYL